MKVLVTGANGQLGYDVVKELQKQNIECCGATRKDFDIIDFEATEKFITNYMPDVVIHCAAYTAVDKAEDEQGLCCLVNASATENIAQICKKIDAKIVLRTSLGELSSFNIPSSVGDNYIIIGIPTHSFVTTPETLISPFAELVVFMSPRIISIVDADEQAVAPDVLVGDALRDFLGTVD